MSDCYHNSDTDPDSASGFSSVRPENMEIGHVSGHRVRILPSTWCRKGANPGEFDGIRETVKNPGSNSGEFAIIRSQAGVNRYTLITKQLEGDAE
jgi:hypothetical protein